jgi:hypothetical protein
MLIRKNSAPGHVLEAMLRKRIVTFLWSGAVTFLIVLVGQGVWGVLVTANLKATPSLPWAVPVMATVLEVPWRFRLARLPGLRTRSRFPSCGSLVEWVLKRTIRKMRRALLSFRLLRTRLVFCNRSAAITVKMSACIA